MNILTKSIYLKKLFERNISLIMNDFGSLFLKLPISDSKSYFSSLDNLLSKKNEKLNNDAFNLLIDTLKEYLFNSPFNEPKRAEHVFDNSAFDKLQSDYRNELDEILLIRTDELNLKFLFQYLTNIGLTTKTQQGGVPGLNRNDAYLKKIPLPSIQEQNRIVAILDKFDAIVNDISIGLPAELEARKKQYEYYREKLLTFKEKATA